MLVRHALRNAAVPIVTVIGLGIALLIGGVVVTESVFTIPGLGRLTVDAVLARDYPTIQAVILLFSFVYVLINLVVDVPTRARSEDPLLMADATLIVPGRRRRPGSRLRIARCCATRAVIGRARSSRIVLLMGCLRPARHTRPGRDQPDPQQGARRRAMIRTDDGSQMLAHRFGTDSSAATSTAACSTAPASRSWSAPRSRRSASPSAWASGCSPASSASWTP